MFRRAVGKNFLTAKEIVKSLQNLSSENSASKNDIENYIPLYSSFDFYMQKIDNTHNISTSSSDNQVDSNSNIVCRTNNNVQQEKVIPRRNRGRKRTCGRLQDTNSDENISDQEVATDGTKWKKILQNAPERQQIHNVLRKNATYAKRRISFEIASSAWRSTLAK